MNEMNNQMPNLPPQYIFQPPVTIPRPFYRAEGRELILALFFAVSCVFLWNGIFNGGFNLAFAIGSVLTIGGSVGYLLLSRHRPDWYSGSLLLFSAAIAAGFARSDDALVKPFLLLVFIGAYNLGITLMAKQNRYAPGGVLSLLDAPTTLFYLGYGGMEQSGRGLVFAFKNGSPAGKKSGAVLVGLLIAIPIIAVMVVLLMGADAAFEGLMDQLPEFNVQIWSLSLCFGIFFAWVMYTRAVALRSREKPQSAAVTIPGFNALTINTILIAVCGVYCVYLFSQLAYFWGGFAGILPEGYTLAEYARRGFFEMAWLCAINLSCISFAIGLVKKDPKTPVLTKLLCLFIGLITVFFTVTSCAKMLLYIDGYGLTRLRLLTEIVTVFLGLSTVVVLVWVFQPKVPYMKVILLLGLAMGAATMWADVDTQVAKYNVSAYQSGKLTQIDMEHLGSLGAGAVPYIEQLTRDSDPLVAQEAKDLLACGWYIDPNWQGWNYSSSAAREILENVPAEAAETENR